MGLLKWAAMLFKSRETNVMAVKPGRNEPCWCGSTKKYKKCHLAVDEERALKSCSLNCGPT
jgi:uncharacterized protein YecA (UPF0149 family)